MDEVGVVGVKENEELDAIRKKWCVCMGGEGGEGGKQREGRLI